MQPYSRDKDMPKPEPLLVKSWEDFFPYSQEITQKKWNRLQLIKKISLL